MPPYEYSTSTSSSTTFTNDSSTPYWTYYYVVGGRYRSGNGNINTSNASHTTRDKIRRIKKLFSELKLPASLFEL